MLQANIADAPRFTHERHLHRRHLTRQYLPSQTRRPGQTEGIRHPVKVIGHFEVGIIDHVVGPVGLAVADGRNTGPRQIIGMDVVGEHIITVNQRRQGIFKTRQRQALIGVNTRGAQDADAHPGTPSPVTQTALGIDPAPGARTFRIQATGLINQRTCAITVNPRRAYVYQAAC